MTGKENTNMNMDKLKIVESEIKASEGEIEKILKWIDLPQCYIKLIKKVNGFIDKKGIKIYSINEIKERNETFEVDKYLPGYVAIGDDSGGNLLIMSACSSAKKVYISDCGSLFLDEREDLVTYDDIAHCTIFFYPETGRTQGVILNMEKEVVSNLYIKAQFILKMLT